MNIDLIGITYFIRLLIESIYMLLFLGYNKITVNVKCQFSNKKIYYLGLRLKLY